MPVTINEITFATVFIINYLHSGKLTRQNTLNILMNEDQERRINRRYLNLF